MKKNSLILGLFLVTFSLMAVGTQGSKDTPNHQEPIQHHHQVNRQFSCQAPSPKLNAVDIYFDVAPRFKHRVTKQQISEAKSIMDIYPLNATLNHRSFHNMKVGVLGDTKEVIEYAEDEFLTQAQQDLLKGMDYSTNFYVHADCKVLNEYSGKWEDGYIVYYITLVPENQVEYKDGQQALVDYLSHESAVYTSVFEREHLQPGKISFTVTKKGKIDGVKLTSTSGYQSVDNNLIRIVKNLPGSWTPASDANGQNVDQELVFYYGMKGC